MTTLSSVAMATSDLLRRSHVETENNVRNQPLVGCDHRGGPSPAPVPTAPASGGKHRDTCSVLKNGRIVNCQRPVAKGKLPPGARNTGTVGSPVQDLASLVDTRTWTTSGGNTFPGADVPFGMVQWSPDTLPDRNAGGGYSYTDTTLDGYSLTHLSGPGCGAAGDVPILPVTAALPAGTDPNTVTTPFSHTDEVAQAGYYAAQSNGSDPMTSAANRTTTASPSSTRCTSTSSSASRSPRRR